jgi:integrase
MGTTTHGKELSARLAKRLNVGESVYFSEGKQYRTRETPDGRWVAKVRRIENGRLTTFPVKSFRAPDEAVAYCESTRPENRRKVGQAVVKSTGRKPSEMTVQGLYEYCRQHRWKRLSGKRITEKESRWRNHIEPYWGTWPLSTVRRSAAQEWVSEKEAELSDGKGLSQLAECRFDLIGYFETAIKFEFYEFANPFEGLDFTAPKRRTRTTIESTDYALILEVMGELVDASLACRWVVDAFTLALLTGMRQGEVLGLRGTSIDLRQKAILVDRAVARNARELDEDGLPHGESKPLALSYPKGGTPDDPRARFVAIPDQLLPLAARLKEQGGGLLFGSEDGKPKQPARFQTAWDTLRSRLGDVRRAEATRWKALNAVIDSAAQKTRKLPDVWEKIDFRDTRNAFASFAAERGIPEPTRMALMGHLGSTVTFRSYTDLTTKAFQDAQRRLSKGW